MWVKFSLDDFQMLCFDVFFLIMYIVKVKFLKRFKIPKNFKMCVI